MERLACNSKNQMQNYFGRIFRRGQIFWTDLGKDNKGSEQNGIRPTIIIQNDVGNKYSPTVIVAILSSQINKAKLPTHVILRREKYEWLKKDSFIAFEQLKTIDKSRIGNFIGEIQEEEFDEAIEISLGLKKFHNANDYYKIAKDKVREVNEIGTVIDYWVHKDKNINLIKDVIDDYSGKIKELLSFANKHNISKDSLNINFIRMDGMVEI